MKTYSVITYNEIIKVRINDMLDFIERQEKIGFHVGIVDDCDWADFMVCFW